VHGMLNTCRAAVYAWSSCDVSRCTAAEGALVGCREEASSGLVSSESRASLVVSDASEANGANAVEKALVVKVVALVTADWHSLCKSSRSWLSSINCSCSSRACSSSRASVAAASAAAVAAAAAASAAASARCRRSRATSSEGSWCIFSRCGSAASCVAPEAEHAT
jgi:hypothetical protein